MPIGPAHTQASLLASLPAGVTRVQVVDANGRTRFKKPEEVVGSDNIVLGTDGSPVVMVGAPGRKKKPEIRPINDTIAETLRAKEMHLQKDDLLGTVRVNPEKGDVLDMVMAGLAEEASSLSFERQMAERTGQPTSQISMRRINALKAVGDSWLKRKEQLASGGVDMDSLAFERLFKFIMDTFKLALEEVGARPEMIETIFTAFSRRVNDDDWPREASKRMTEG